MIPTPHGSLLQLVRESGGAFGMAVGRGTDADPDEVVDVQIAATGATAAALVRVVKDWHAFYTGEATS